MRPVVEQEQVAVWERHRRVLTGERRRTELPDNLTRFPIDDDDGGDVTKAHNNIAIRHLRKTVGVSPRFTQILYRRNAVFRRIEVFPGMPFPNHSPVRRHLDEIVCVHLTVVFSAGAAALDLRYQMLRQLSQAN